MAKRQSTLGQLALDFRAFASGLPGDDIFRTEAPAALPRDRSAEYRAYLLTARWAELREECFQRDDRRCRTCNSPRELAAHHREYPEVFGTETVDDLTTLCRGCHAVFRWFRRLEQERNADPWAADRAR